MEKQRSQKKKKTIERILTNQYNYLKGQKQRNDLKNFSLDLQRVRRDNVSFPAINISKRNRIDGMTEKTRDIRSKVIPQIKLGNSQRTYQKPMSFPITMPMSYQMPYQMPYQVPYQIPYQVPYQMPYYYPSYNYTPPCPQCIHEKPKERRKGKKEKKPKQQKQVVKKNKKVNKFRICGYVVYFMLFMKYYSQKFTANRKKWFIDRYSKRNGGIIYEGSQKILEKLLSLDFYRISQNAKIIKRVNGQNMIDWEEETKTALVPDAQYSDGTNKVATSQYIINATQILLEKLEQIFCDQEYMSEYHETFSAGSLDKSFLIDNLYLPQQTPFLFIHPKKGYLRLEHQSQMHLLLMKVMVKMVIYNYLFGVERNQSWTMHLEKVNKLAEFEIKQIFELIRIIGVYLYLMCTEMYMEGLKSLSHVSNFYELRNKFGIMQAKNLQQASIQPKEDNKVDKYELIKNIKNFQYIKEKITRNSNLMDHKQIFKVKIISILNKIHQVMKGQEKELYLYIKNITISHKYIIFEGIENSKNGHKKKKREEKFLKPNRYRDQAADWNNIYAERPSDNAQSSYSNDINKMGNEILKTEESTLRSNPINKGFLRLPLKNIQQTFNSIQIPTKKGFSAQISQYESSFSEHIEPRGINSNYQRTYQMKKPFNIDTINSKFDENRQDRLRQKFRNILNKNN